MPCPPHSAVALGVRAAAGTGWKSSWSWRFSAFMFVQWGRRTVIKWVVIYMLIKRPQVLLLNGKKGWGSLGRWGQWLCMCSRGGLRDCQAAGRWEPRPKQDGAWMLGSAGWTLEQQVSGRPPEWPGAVGPRSPSPFFVCGFSSWDGSHGRVWSRSLRKIWLLRQGFADDTVFVNKVLSARRHAC